MLSGEWIRESLPWIAVLILFTLLVKLWTRMGYPKPIAENFERPLLRAEEHQLLAILFAKHPGLGLEDVFRSPTLFEKLVAELREADPQHPGLSLVSSLRRRLYVPLTSTGAGIQDTRAIPVGQSLRVRFSLPDQRVGYVARVLENSAEGLLVTVPRQGGRPMVPSSVRDVLVSFFLEKHGEYESLLRVRATQGYALLLEHNPLEYRPLEAAAAMHAHVEMRVPVAGGYVSRPLAGEITGLAPSLAHIRTRGPAAPGVGVAVSLRRPGEGETDEVHARVAQNLPSVAEGNRLILSFAQMGERERLKLERLVGQGAPASNDPR